MKNLPSARSFPSLAAIRSGAWALGAAVLLSASAAVLLAASAAVLLATGTASAVESGPTTPEFPQYPENWINSGPISVSTLKGKAVFLWFFEEGCATCKAKWPGLLATAQQFEGKPILFIGVNSGNSREDVAEYVQEVGCPWPVIVDGTRLYEKQVLDHAISLENVMQARVIRADGEMAVGSWNDVAQTIETALKGAKWRVDPVDMPDALRPAWQSIEFGDYPAAAGLIRKSLLSKKPDIKSAAEKLNATVRTEIDKNLATAKTSLSAGDKWGAYQTYQMVGEDFAGYELPADVVESKKKLATDPSIKQEIIAAQNLGKAKKLMASGKPNSHKRVVLMLEKLVKDQTDTSAAKEAKALLNQFETESGGAGKGAGN